MAFRPGERIRVRTTVPRGHCRTPWYLRGKEGVVEAGLGAFRNPEELAYHRDGLPEIELYRVRFRQARLWPDYGGGPSDTLLADIYEHWLEPAEGRR